MGAQRVLLGTLVLGGSSREFFLGADVGKCFRDLYRVRTLRMGPLLVAASTIWFL